MKTSLKHIHSFLAVAETSSFTVAAEKLHIAQPPLSRRIKELEDELQVTLFNRNTRSVELTEAGRVFQKEMVRIIDDMALAVLKCKNAADSYRGSLTIGYTGRASDGLLPRVLRSLRSGFPEINVELTGPMTSGDLEQQLLHAKIDLALCFLPLKHAGIEHFPMRICQLSLVLPDTHPLANKNDIKLSSLEAENFVGYPARQGFFLRDAMETVCRDSGFTPKMAKESSSSQSLLCLVAARTGIAILPSELENLKIEGLVFKRIASKVNNFNYGLAWNGRKTNALLKAVLAEATLL